MTPAEDLARRSVPVTPDMYHNASAVMAFLAAQATKTDLTTPRKEADNGRR